MTCLVISVNNELVCTAGSSIPSRIEATVNVSTGSYSGVPTEELVILSLVGVDETSVFHWPRKELRLGDTVTIQVVERQIADTPVQNPALVAATEQLERATYLRLKQKFDPA
jgi:hypothetical protein